MKNKVSLNNVLNKFRAICKDKSVEDSFVLAMKNGNLDLAIDILFNLPYLTLRKFMIYLIDLHNKELEELKVQERIRDKTA